MNYTLNQLRIFLKVAQTRSVTKAAYELHLTQPAVSIQLKNFQDQFKVPLIEVVNKKIYVTDFGLEIVDAATKILDEVHAIDYKMQAFKGELTGKLKVSVVSTGKYIAPFFLADFLKQNQGVELLLDVTNKAQVIQSLENNEVDFSLVSVLPEKLSIDKVELMQNKLFVVGNQDRKFTKKQYDKSIFENIPLIYREQGSGTRHVMEKFIFKNNLPVKKKMELTKIKFSSRLKTHKFFNKVVNNILVENKTINFLRNTHIQNIFFIHNRFFIRNELSELKMDKKRWALWKTLLVENNIGDPIKYFLYPKL